MTLASAFGFSLDLLLLGLDHGLWHTPRIVLRAQHQCPEFLTKNRGGTIAEEATKLDLDRLDVWICLLEEIVAHLHDDIILGSEELGDPPGDPLLDQVHLDLAGVYLDVEFGGEFSRQKALLVDRHAPVVQCEIVAVPSTFFPSLKNYE